MCEHSASPRIVGYIVLLALVSSSGCDRPGDTSPPDPPVGSIEQDIRIGSLNEPGYAFSEVKALEVAPDGSMYSLHPQEALIRLWSSAGDAIGTIGRRGGGPGEFDTPKTIGWRGDSLWVFDSSLSSRISFFDESGTYLGALTPALDIGTAEQAADGIFPPRPAGLLGDGTVHGVTPAFSRDVSEGRLTSIAHVRMKPDGSTIDTILTIPVGPEAVLGIARGGGTLFSTQPFRDGVLSTLTSNGRAFLILERPSSRSGDQGEFRLTRIELDGDTAYSRSYPYEPTPLPTDTVESYISALAERLQGSVGQRSGMATAKWVGLIREAVYTPEFYPPVSQLVAGRDGTIWLARSPATESSTEWLVLDKDGKPIGTVEIPGAMTLMVADRSMIWGIERDEFDVDYIVRYRISFPETKQQGHRP